MLSYIPLRRRLIDAEAHSRRHRYCTIIILVKDFVTLAITVIVFIVTTKP